MCIYIYIYIYLFICFLFLTVPKWPCLFFWPVPVSWVWHSTTCHNIADFIQYPNPPKPQIPTPKNHHPPTRAGGRGTGWGKWGFGVGGMGYSGYRGRFDLVCYRTKPRDQNRVFQSRVWRRWITCATLGLEFRCVQFQHIGFCV